MSVTRFKEVWRGDASERGGLVRRYRRVFNARTDALTDRARHVRLHSGCPQEGEPYPLDALALCGFVNAEHVEDDPYEYEVTAEYSTEFSVVTSDNPLLRPPDREFNFITYREIYYRDESAARKAVLNSAGMPFATAPERDRAYPVYRITINEAGFPFANAVLYAFATNADIWNGFAIGQGMAFPITGREERKGALTYWRNTYEIALKEEGWDDFILNTGRYVKKQVSTGLPGIFKWEPDPILGTDELPVQDDVVLSPDGLSSKSLDDPPVDEDYLRFQPQKQRTFSGVIPT